MNQIIQEIEPSGIRKFFDAVSEMKGAISLGVGEPDFHTPWHIREEGIYSLERGRTHYTSNAGLPELKREIARYLERRCQVSYDPVHEVMVTVGGSEAIDLALRAMLDPGDEVLIPQPSYVSYLPCTQLAGGIPVPLPLKEEHQFKLTKQELEAAITEKTKILVLPYPNNPTGAMMTGEDLAPLAEVIKERDIFVLTDEIYSELTYGTNHGSITSFPGMKERCVLINGFSKAYAMTGWRIGYTASATLLSKAIGSMQSHMASNANTIAQYASEAALVHDEGEKFLKLMRETFDRRRQLMIRLLDGMPQVTYIEPLGAFYVMVGIEGLLGKTLSGCKIDTALDFANALLEKEKVAVIPCESFGADGYIRLSYAISESDIAHGLDGIKRFIAG